MRTSWLPPEVGGACQPYSMLPLLARTGHDARYASPAMGTLVPLDRSEVSIRMCLVAPSRVQRAAQAQGVKAMVMIRPKGIEKIDSKLHAALVAEMLGQEKRSDGLDLAEVRDVQMSGMAGPLTVPKRIADIVEGLES